MIKTPYLLFLGDAPDALAAKVAQESRIGDLMLVLGNFEWQDVMQIWVCQK